MNIVLDASSIINLHNVAALDAAGHLRRCFFLLTPLVVGECQASSAAKLLELKAAGVIGFVDDTTIPTELFLRLLAEHRLGPGETEAISVCQLLGYALCCDDRSARRVGKEVLGDDRVIGSLRVLRWCVEETLFDCIVAFELFQQMRAAGGFLPQIGQPFFCNRNRAC
jgi:predicted nucleic acid-binding protein